MFHGPIPIIVTMKTGGVAKRDLRLSKQRLTCPQCLLIVAGITIRFNARPLAGNPNAVNRRVLYTRSFAYAIGHAAGRALSMGMAIMRNRTTRAGGKEGTRR